MLIEPPKKEVSFKPALVLGAITVGLLALSIIFGMLASLTFSDAHPSGLIVFNVIMAVSLVGCVVGCVVTPIVFSVLMYRDDGLTALTVGASIAMLFCSLFAFLVLCGICGAITGTDAQPNGWSIFWTGAMVSLLGMAACVVAFPIAVPAAKSYERRQ